MLLNSGATRRAEAAPSTNLTDLHLTEMVERIRKRQISPSELVKAHIERIDEFEPKVNAVADLDADSALKTAKELDQELVKGRVDFEQRFLFGIPFSAKGAMDVARVRNTLGGAPARAHSVPDRDAYYVNRYKEAGAIFLATTNTPLLGNTIETDNALFGKTCNPHNLNRTVGGSSGGEAALITCGGTPMGIASDAGGSIRMPAHFCGLFGLVPAANGQHWSGFPGLPDEGFPEPPFARLGTMGRSVADLELVKDVFIEPGRSTSARPLVDAQSIKLSDLRIIFFTHWPEYPAGVNPEVKAAVERAARVLEKAGANVTEKLPKFLEDTYHIGHNLNLKHLRPNEMRQRARELGAETDVSYEQFVKLVEKYDELYSQEARGTWLAAYSGWRAQFDQLFRDIDAIVLPVTGTPAPKHGEMHRQMSFCDNSVGFNFVANLSDSATAGTAPVARSEEGGLPIGAGVVCKPFAEDVVLRILYEWEKAFGGHIRPDI